MDTLRDGTFQLANTNKLIRFYDGATGLKTGSTDSAKYCLSATAEREGMELIAVVLKLSLIHIWGSTSTGPRSSASRSGTPWGWMISPITRSRYPLWEPLWLSLIHI